MGGIRRITSPPSRSCGIEKMKPAFAHAGQDRVGSNRVRRDSFFQSLPPVQQDGELVSFLFPFRREERQDSLSVRRHIKQKRIQRQPEQGLRRSKVQTGRARFDRYHHQLSVRRLVVQLLTVTPPVGRSTPVIGNLPSRT